MHAMDTAAEPLPAGTLQRARLGVSTLCTACKLLQEYKAAACGLERLSTVMRGDTTTAHLQLPTADELTS